jgi:hypothetical protein
MGIVTVLQVPKKFGRIGQTFRNLMVGQTFSDLVTCPMGLLESPLNCISDTRIAIEKTNYLDPLAA